MSEPSRAVPESEHRLNLGEDEVHVWYASPAALDDEAGRERCDAVLSADEAARRERFVFERNRHEYRVAHALARRALSLYAPVEPAAWRFGAGEHGKPFVDAPAEHRALSFNLSHTEGLVACIVARAREVGVDVEHTGERSRGRPRRLADIADRFFAPAEVDALRALPTEAAQRERFFAYWTLKEAYIKARGYGLALPLDGFAFDVTRAPITITFAASVPDEPSTWRFERWRVGLDHACAYALRVRPGEGPPRVRIRDAAALLAGEAPQA